MPVDGWEVVFRDEEAHYLELSPNGHSVVSLQEVDRRGWNGVAVADDYVTDSLLPHLTNAESEPAEQLTYSEDESGDLSLGGARARGDQTTYLGKSYWTFTVVASVRNRDGLTVLVTLLYDSTQNPDAYINDYLTMLYSVLDAQLAAPSL